MKNSLVLRLDTINHVTASNRRDAINAKGRLALDDSKNSRSTQYWTSHREMAIRIARETHNFALNKPHRRMTPATIQPAPVMDK